MSTQKLSISISQRQYDFLEAYRKIHHYKTRSEVIKEALKILQQLELEACYREASQEIDPAFDSTIADGLDDETW